PVRAGVGMSDGSADRAPVADLRIADPCRDIGEQPVRRDDPALEDLTMRGAAADAQVLIVFGDAVEALYVVEVDQQFGLGKSQLEQRDQAEAAREELRPLALAKNREHLIEGSRAHVVELGRNQCRRCLLVAGRRLTVAAAAGIPAPRPASVVHLGYTRRGTRD